MKKIRSCSLSALLALSALAGVAQASVVYSYVGNNFTSADNYTDATYNTSMSVSGSLTLADGAWANLSNATVAPLSFDFFDGRRHYNQGNVDTTIFRLTTNGAGAITNWFVYLFDNAPGGINGFEEIISQNGIDEGERVNYGVCNSACVSRGYGYVSGIWSVTGLTVPPPAPDPGRVPEPQTLALVLAAFGALALTRRGQAR